MRGAAALLVLLAAASLPACEAAAGAMRIMPVRVDVAANARFCQLTLANLDNGPVSVQIRGYRWSQDDEGQEQLAPDPALVVNPAIVTLENGQDRLIRCSLPPVQGQTEESWRLVFDELPSPGTMAPEGSVRALLRISVPVFRAPDGATADLAWSLTSESGRPPALQIENRGSRHVRILGMEILPQDTRRPAATIAQSLYILSGRSAAVALPQGFTGGVALLRVRTADGEIDIAASGPA